jgi:FkbM family methyltransferase
MFSDKMERGTGMSRMRSGARALLRWVNGGGGDTSRLTRNDVIAAFEIVLGRRPESEDAIRHHLGLGLTSRVALGERLLQTPEGSARVRHLLGQRAIRPAHLFLGDRVLSYTHTGARIYLAPDDVDLTPHMLETGVWERHVEQAVRRLLRPGQAAADIGANVGYHTLAIAEAVGPAGRVDAFEANPVVARLLRSTLFVNGLAERVRLHDVAVSDTAGHLIIAASPGHLGSGNVLLAGDPPSYAAAYPIRAEVPATRLDDALADLPVLNLLRMDVEGFEPRALLGGETLIRRSPDLCVVAEWSVPMMSSRADVPAFINWITALDFRFWIIGSNSELEAVPTDALLSLPHSDVVMARSEPV